MFKVSTAVEEILKADPIALSAYNYGYLNLSAYADTILNLVERKCMKTVHKGTIVVALSRLSNTKTKFSLMPEINISNLSLELGLCELTYEKNSQNLSYLNQILESQTTSTDFFTFTKGVSEITFISKNSLKTQIQATFSDSEPIFILEDLASVTIKFGSEYIETPNMFFSLFSKIAIKQIQIIEIISTYTEITFIVKREEVNNLFSILNQYIQID